MKLWLLTQNKVKGWGAFDAVIVAAPDKNSASTVHPSPNAKWDEDLQDWIWDRDWTKEKEPFHKENWASSPSKVKVEYLGEAKEGTVQGVILSSVTE